MDNLSRKQVFASSSEFPSPVLFRRRLSAPETVMRKHTLAQERSDSQESDSACSFDVPNSRWRTDKGVGSDPYLNKKRDNNLIRKSTLLRRLWGSTKPLSERHSKYSSAYSEWQHEKIVKGKSAYNLCSNNSSPEHIRHSKRYSGSSEEMKTSPIHSRYEKETRQASRTRSFTTVGNNNTSFDNSSSSTTRNSTATDFDSEKYTRSTSTELNTTFSENSDVMYKRNNINLKNVKTFTDTSSLCTSNVSSETFLEENGNNFNEDANATFSENVLKSKNDDKVNDTSTQTIDTANVNVISNVQLSPSTLNLIFNKVLQDVQTCPSTNNVTVNTTSANIPLQNTNYSTITSTKVIDPSQAPSFFLNKKEPLNLQEQRLMKFNMVTNVGAGSLYSKPSENPQVVIPRFSARPLTTSMEVNVSSNESDKESDNISLMDSLEDQNSPRIDSSKCNKHDEKPVRGELSPLLPDNSHINRFGKAEIKASAFYVPIKSDVEVDCKSVADHLPDKVKEKLSKRQLKREQKIRQSKFATSPKTDSNYVSASENGNQVLYEPCDSNSKTFQNNANVLPNINLNKMRRKYKPPQLNRKSTRKIDIKEISNNGIEKLKVVDKETNKSIKRKLEHPKTHITHSSDFTKQEIRISKTRQKILEPINTVYSTKNYVYDVIPKRIFHKTEVNNFDKRIEILEIVECVDPTAQNDTQRDSKNKKSKIPVFVNSPKLPSISRNENRQKPIFLDFDQIHNDDPKIDQLIANILIDALNKPDIQIGTERRIKTRSPLNINENRSTVVHTPQSRHKYQQMFESIPEEKSISLQNSSESSSNSSKSRKSETFLENDRNKSFKTSYRIEKSSTSRNVTSEDNLDKSKEWYSFYGHRQNEESIRNASDEGKKNVTPEQKIFNETTKFENERYSPKPDDTDFKTKDLIPNIKTNNYISTSREKLLSQDSFDTWTSSDQDKNRHKLSSSAYASKTHQKKERYRSSDVSSSNNVPISNGWTVTVSGTTSCGQVCPELEMRLKFPSDGKGNINGNHHQSDSGLGEEHFCERKQHLFDRSNDLEKYRYSKSDIQDLPRLVHQNLTRRRSSECESQINNYVKPRQTKTSYRRLLLNRPKTFVPESEQISETENQDLQEIIRKLPAILKIRGNALNSQSKSSLYTTKDRDITR